jgi:hypothetical protein
MSSGPGLMMDVLMLSLKPAKFAHKNGELCTDKKYDTDLSPDVFDLRVTLRFIQTRRDGTENVERTIASSFWRANGSQTTEASGQDKTAQISAKDLSGAFALLPAVVRVIMGSNGSISCLFHHYAPITKCAQRRSASVDYSFRGCIRKARFPPSLSIELFQ